MSTINPTLDPKIRAVIHTLPQPMSNRTIWRIFTLSLIVSDALMMAIAFRLAYAIRFEFSISIFHLEAVPKLAYYQNLVVILLPLWLLIFFASGLYQRQKLLGGTQEYQAIFNCVTIGIFLVILVSFLIPEFVLSRGWLLLAWVLAIVLTSLSRFFLRRLAYTSRQRGYFMAPALIVGANQEGRLIADQLSASPTSGLHLLGFIDEQFSPGTNLFKQIHVLGSIDVLDEIIRRYGVEEIIIATSALSREEIVLLFKRYGLSPHLNLRLSSGVFEILTTGLRVKELAYVPLVSVNKVRLTGLDQLFKYVLDYSLTLPGVILITPLLAILSLAIRFDSPGPIIHRRRVMGVNGREYDAFKFRTMYQNGDEILAKHPELVEELARNHKLKEDPRITRVGAFLRKFSLDELPQLFNVLRGDMSLVGPRMITPEEMPKYEQWGMNLLTVRPGLTGLWQVSGRSDLSYQDRVRLDMYYIRNWTIWLDFQLLFQTIPTVIRGKGAY
jgi:exopolysaccharide biosynthesis polyprenyl glycosylphosphotransferase